MMQGGPLEHCIAGKAVCLKEAMTEDFRTYAERTVRDARALAAALGDEGIRIVSGGTDSHLVLADVRPIGVDGKEAERLLDEVGIALNKNQIPFDPNPPSAPSGIRVGTPACSTLGMDEAEMREIGGIIGDVLRSPEDAGVREKGRGRVSDLMQRFPLYP
jgi:glycine hydroxymethyltransferase